MTWKILEPGTITLEGTKFNIRLRDSDGMFVITHDGRTHGFHPTLAAAKAAVETGIEERRELGLS